MTFWEKEKSLAQSEPYELHEFFTGNQIQYYYSKFIIGVNYAAPGVTYNISVRGITDSGVDTSWGNNGFFGYEVEGDGAGTIIPYDYLQLSDNTTIASFARFDLDGSNYAYLCKIKTDGTLDTTWGTNGFFVRPIALGYWTAFYKLLQDNDGYIYAFGGGGGATSRGFVKIDSNGNYVDTLMDGSYTFITAIDAIWADTAKTKILVISQTDENIGGTYPVNILQVDLTTEDLDASFTGNVSKDGCADFGGGAKVRKLSDGNYVTFKNGSPTMQKFLSDGSALDTTWGNSGQLDIGDFAWSVNANRITIDVDYIYCIANKTISGTINNIIYKIDSTGTIEKQHNIASGTNSLYHCIQTVGNKLILGTLRTSPAHYNIEFWSKDLVYESGFDVLDGAKEPDIILTIRYDSAGRYFGDYIRDNTWRFADAPEDVVYNGYVYTACYITGEKIEEGSSTVKNRTVVKTNWNNPFAWLYTTSIPGTIVRYKRFRGQNGDYRLIFFGEVLAVEFKQADRKGNRYVDISIEPQRGAFEEIGLISRYSRQCTVELYSAQCGVIQDNYKETGTLDSFTGNVLTSTTFGGQADGYWAGGKIYFNSIPSKVMSHTGNDIIILPYRYDINAGDSFSIYPGCDHLYSGDCTNIFNNGPDYRGQPNIPLDNIFTKLLTSY